MRAHAQLASLAVLENDLKEAMAQAQTEPAGIWRDYATAMVLQAGADREAADTALRGMIDKYSKVAGYQIAILYAMRHEPDEMFKWLETAYTNKDGGLTQLLVAPFLSNYRDDARLASFCAKLGVELPAAKR